MLDPSASEVQVEIGDHDFAIRQSPGALNSDRAGGTTGAVAWRASVLLGRALCSPESKLLRTVDIDSSSTVLELGAGVAGIVPVLLAPRIGKYIATDQKYTLKLLEKNIRANAKDRMGKKIECLSLDWEMNDTPSLLQANGINGVRLVVACDCIYNFALIQPLVGAMASVCRMHSDARTACLVVQPLRQADVFEAWLNAMMESFDVYRLGSDSFGADLGSGYAAHVAWLRSD